MDGISITHPRNISHEDSDRIAFFSLMSWDINVSIKQHLLSVLFKTYIGRIPLGTPVVDAKIKRFGVLAAQNAPGSEYNSATDR